MHDDPRSDLRSGQSVSGVGLADVLPLLVGPGRSGRLSGAQNDGPTLDVWIARGRVVHASWGRVGALSALEMAAVFLPQTSFTFLDGQQAQTRSFDLSPSDLAFRLARVAREGAALTAWIPGPQAVPARLPPPPQGLARDRGAERLLEQIDGRRTVAELVDGHQPLTVLRELASLVVQGAIAFKPDAPPAPLAEALSAAPAASALTPPPTLPTVAATPGGTSGLSAPRASRLTRMAGLGLVVGALIVVIVNSVQTVSLAPETELPVAAPRPGATVAGVQTRAAAQPAPVVAPTSPTQPSPDVAPTATALAAPSVAPATPAPTAPVAAPTTPVEPTPVVAATATPAPAVAPTATALPLVVAPTSTVPPAPTPTAVIVASPTAAATQQSTQAPSATAAPRILLDESFRGSPPGWPNAANSPAFLDSLGYHLEPRVAGQHVAVAAPIGTSLADVSVTGLFRKSGGPIGGGYGLVMRAQGATLDGINQGGRYYVFEVGDRGEVGAWRREQDRWVELLPWTASEAVHPGNAENRLDVRASGSRFTFSVNDAQVAELTDPTLASGAVGAFVGGDGNQVLLERFTAAAP